MTCQGVKNPLRNWKRKRPNPGSGTMPRRPSAKCRNWANYSSRWELWHGLRTQVADLLELTELAIESDDESVATELSTETAAAATSLAKAEMELTLSGPTMNGQRY